MILNLAAYASMLFTHGSDLADRLAVAVTNADAAGVRQLLREGGNVNGVDALGTPLIEKAIEGYKYEGGDEVFDALILAGVNVNAPQPDGWTPLHLAISHHEVDVLKILLAKRANLNSDAPGEGTPLELASSLNDSDVVKLLVDDGADVNARMAGYLKPLEPTRKEYDLYGQESGDDCSGKTPLMTCAQASPDSTKVAEYLLSHGANVNATDSMGRTALHEAARLGNVPLAKLLISKGANLEARTKGGQTPLHMGVRPFFNAEETVAMVSLLLEHGADADAKTSAGETPLDLRSLAVMQYASQLQEQNTGSTNQLSADAKEALDNIDEQSKSIIELLAKYWKPRKV